MTRLLEEILGHTAKTPHKLSSADKSLIQDLRRAHAFDITDLMSIMPDWSDLRTTAVPKTPPFDLTWAEWSWCDSGETGSETWRVGALYQRFPAGAVSAWLSESANKSELVIDDLEQLKERPVVVATAFSKMTSCIPPDRGIDGIGVLSAELPLYIFFLGPPDESQVRIISNVRKPLGRSYPGFGLGLPFHMGFPGKDPYWHGAAPWAGVAAFSLLHCKNVTTELESKPKGSVMRRLKKRPLIDYHVLRVLAPRTVKKCKQQGSDATSHDDAPSVRLHVCRGHYKNLQHDRFKSKGWHWWPAHWRGDPSLGVLDKDYHASPGVGEK